jgi:hypothetical protein
MDFQLEYQIYYRPNEVITLKPIFDVHLGNVQCDIDAFKQYVTPDPLTYFIGGGDLLDSVITRDIKRYSKASDASVGDAIIDEQVDEMVKILTPVKKNIIGIGSGNHEAKITIHCGTDPAARLCKELGTRYLGYSWLVDLTFINKKSGHWDNLIIKGNHGWGSSRTQGGDLTKYSRDVGYWDADLFLYGHCHRHQYDEFPRIGVKKGKLYARPKIMVICGSFLKTLSDGPIPSYSEQAGYPPVSIGGIPIHIKPGKDGMEIWTEMKVKIK